MDRNHLIFIRVWVCCLAGIALLVTSGQGVEIYNPTPICPSSWTVSNVTPNGTCLQGVVSPANWTMAQEICRNRDSFLLKIESDGFRTGQRYVGMVFGQGLGEFWTGLHVHDKTGHFVWDELGPFKVKDFISNDGLSFVWAEGQPDIRSGSCVSARAGAGLNTPLTFSLRPCSQRRPFICQRSKVVPEAFPGTPCFETFYGGLYSDECYKIEGRTVSQSEAQRNCGRIHGGGDRYGQLVEPKSKLDEQYLMNAVLKWHNEQVEISSEMEFWTGLQFDQSAERLTWMSGSAVNFSSYLVQEDPLRGGPPNASFNCAKLVVSPPIIDTPVTLGIFWAWRNCSLPAVQICQLARSGFGKPDLQIAVVMDGVNKTSRKNQFGGDLPLDISIPTSPQNRLFSLNFNLVFSKITPLGSAVYVQNWIAGQPASNQQRQGLQGYHWANVWQAHPLKKHRTNRILIIEQYYLTYRCQVDVSALFIIPTAVMNNYNLFGYTLRQAAEKWQELGIVYQMFDQTVPRLLKESLAPWVTSVSLRRFQLHVQGRTVKQIVHFDVYLSGSNPDARMSDRDDFAGRQNLTQALTTVLRSLLVEYESLEALRNTTLSSLKVFSTRHCFPTETVPSTGVHRQPFCPETDSALEAVCGGDFYDGLRWKVAKAGCTTTPLTTPSTTTAGEYSINDELDKILQQEVNAETSFDISQSVAQLSANPSMLNTETIGKITDILERIADQNTIDIMSGGRLCQTVENLMNVEESVLRMSQRVNSTSTRLLKTLDRYTGHADLGRPNQKQTYTTLAVDMWDVRPGQSVYGVRLLQSPPGGDPFTNQTFQNAERDSDDDDEDDNEMEYNITNVEVAIFLPPLLIEEKLEDTQPGQNLRMSFIIQTNPVLFKDVSLRSSQSLLNGSVISATLGVSEIVGLPADQRIRAVFYSPQTNISKPMCVFWDFGLNAGSGGWSGAGCELLNTTSPGGYYECLCDHLTNFAVLMDFGGPIDPVNNKILTVITIVGLSLSIIGLSLTVLSFLLFRKLREGNTQKTMFHLALSLLAAWILFLVGIILSQESLHDRVGCQVVAVLLHYFLLASFMWMLVEAVLQYLRFVKVLGTYIPKFLLKASVIAWGVPLIPVIVVLAINTDLYYRSGSANVTKFCWMDQYTSYFAFLLPVGLIIVVNAVVFILIVWAITHRPKGLQSNQSKTKNNMISLQAAIACFILLGLTWIFGFLAIEDARLVFQYLFTILNSFHGLFIFVFFTLREKKVRQQWLELCCPKTARKQLYTSSEMYSNTQKRGSEETLSGGTTDTVVPSSINKPRFKRIDSSGNSVIFEPDSSKKMLNGPKN